MTIPAWPSTVPTQGPNFQRKYAADSAVSVMQVEEGRPLMRVQGNTPFVEFQWTSVPLTAAQKVTLEDFLHTTLLRGTLDFTMLVPLITTCVTRRCFIPGGTPAVRDSRAGGYVVTFPITAYRNVSS